MVNNIKFVANLQIKCCEFIDIIVSNTGCDFEINWIVRLKVIKVQVNQNLRH